MEHEPSLGLFTTNPVAQSDDNTHYSPNVGQKLISTKAYPKPSDVATGARPDVGSRPLQRLLSSWSHINHLC